MTPNPEFESDWQLLPGREWTSVLSAKTWLIEKRRQLEWSHKDVEKAFWKCATNSDLYTGNGGGERFPRATEKRVARFEKEGTEIPLWLHWIPLAAAHSKISPSKQWDWERANIPAHSQTRRDAEEADYQSHLFELNDEEISLISSFRQLNADQRTFLCRVAHPEMLAKLIAAFSAGTASGGGNPN